MQRSDRKSYSRLIMSGQGRNQARTANYGHPNILRFLEKTSIDVPSSANASKMFQGPKGSYYPLICAVNDANASRPFPCIL